MTQTRFHNDFVRGGCAGKGRPSRADQRQVTERETRMLGRAAPLVASTSASRQEQCGGVPRLGRPLAVESERPSEVRFARLKLNVSCTTGSPPPRTSSRPPTDDSENRLRKPADFPKDEFPESTAGTPQASPATPRWSV